MTQQQIIAKPAFKHLPKRYSSIPLLAVDAGIAPLLATSSKMLLMVRVGCVVFKDMERKHQTIHQAMLQATLDDDDSWHIQLCPEYAKDVFFQSLSSKLPAKDSQEVIDTVRVQAEELMLLHCASNQYVNGVVLYDGMLSVLPQSQAICDTLLAKGILLVGIAKHTNLRVQTIPTQEFLIEQARSSGMQSFYCEDAFSTNKNCQIHWCKFHANSQHIFGITTPLIQQEIDLEKVFSVIAQYAVDPVFLGYPYPLVFVDQLVRVSHQECARLCTKYAFSSAQAYELYQQSTRANPHGILDSLQY